MNTLAEWGGFAFGTIIGWYVYYINRYRRGEVGFQDITALVGAIGGGAVTALFSTAGTLFAAYGIGLAVGFFAYFILLLILVRNSPNFDSDWFLDGRRRKLGEDFEIPGSIAQTVRPASLRPVEADHATPLPGYLPPGGSPTLRLPFELELVQRDPQVRAAHLPASMAAKAPVQIAAAKDIIASCQTLWDANKNACNDFVTAVAKDQGVTLTGQADDILRAIKGTGWTAEADGKAADAAAKAGKLVVGGLTAADLGDTNGHVVIVIDGTPEHGKYPAAYWGSLNEKIRENGGKGIGVNWCFSKAVRDKVQYASKPV
ncbi:hypothetical protein [Xanthobacter autotrophicus]|uniref:hypothetical protein n=1 Tax=Xanthobacter autotrophicus TaxID=280 RepID=UPI00372B478E